MLKMTKLYQGNEEALMRFNETSRPTARSYHSKVQRCPAQAETLNPETTSACFSQSN